MLIQKIVWQASGYYVYIDYKGVENSFKIEIDMEFGVNIPATGSFKTKEDRENLIEGIKIAYKLFSKEIYIEEL